MSSYQRGLQCISVVVDYEAGLAWLAKLCLVAGFSATKTQANRHIPIRDDRCEQFQSPVVLPETLPAKVSGGQLCSHLLSLASRTFWSGGQCLAEKSASGSSMIPACTPIVMQIHRAAWGCRADYHLIFSALTRPSPAGMR